MPDETNIQRILTYVSQHGSDYPLSILREQLLTVGYTSEDIEAAFARLPEQAAPAAAPEVVAPAAPPSAPPSQEQPASPIADDEAEIKRMVSYLRQHIAKYSIEALRAQLLATGQPPNRVETAIARVQVEQPVKKQAVWPLGLCVAVLNVLLLPILLGLLASAVSQLPYGSVWGIQLLWIWPLTLVGELIAGFLLRSGPRERLGRILLYGVLFSVVIPIVLAILLAGICLIFVAGPSLFR